MAPFQLGGRIVEWVAGAYAGVGALAAVRRARALGVGELVDVALCDVANLTGGNYADLFQSLAGRPELDPDLPYRTVEIPSIEPTLDGWVGFNTNTRDQWDSFCILIERPDLLETAEFASLATRIARRDEWNAMVREWTTRHTTADIVEQAALLRIPVAPVSSGRDVLELDHPRLTRGVWVADPTGSFEMPRRPYRFDGEPTPTPRPAPAVGEHDGQPAPRAAAPAPRPRPAGRRCPSRASPCSTSPPGGPARRARRSSPRSAPTSCTSSPPAASTACAPPAACSSAARSGGSTAPSSSRPTSTSTTSPSPSTRPQGRELALELVKKADIVIENFTPRVIEAFDLDWPVVHEANPRAIMVRMPAFGLDGPWRDRPGFAQTMEQITGLAWVTSHPDDQPRIQRGPCDPNGGLHAVFAALVALERRDRTGEGCFVEAPMFEAAHERRRRAGHRVERQRRAGRAHGQPQPGGRPAEPLRHRPARALAGRLVQHRRAVAGAGRRDRPPRAGRRARARRPWPVAAPRPTGSTRSSPSGPPAASCTPPSPSCSPPVCPPRPAPTPAGPRSTSRWPPGATSRPSSTRSSAPTPMPVLPFRYGSVERWARRPAPTARPAQRRDPRRAGSATPTTSSPPSRPRASSAPGPKRPEPPHPQEHEHEPTMTDLFDRYRASSTSTPTSPSRPTLWTRACPAALHDQVPHIERIDGRDIWMVERRAHRRARATTRWPATTASCPTSIPETYDDIAAGDVRRRRPGSTFLDARGHPTPRSSTRTSGGFGNGYFLRLGDRELVAASASGPTTTSSPTGAAADPDRLLPITAAAVLGPRPRHRRDRAVRRPWATGPSTSATSPRTTASRRWPTPTGTRSGPRPRTPASPVNFHVGGGSHGHPVRGHRGHGAG